MSDRSTFGIAAFALFLACIPLANWMIGHVGTLCPPDAPCQIPVAPGILAPSGVLMIGVALVLRDTVQRLLGSVWALVAVAFGTAVSFILAPPALVLASGVAFLLSELADFAVYTPLQRRRLLLAVLASSAAGLVVDSIVFLTLAFGSLDYVGGQIIGKAWALLIAFPLVRLLRRVTPAPT